MVDVTGSVGVMEISAVGSTDELARSADGVEDSAKSIWSAGAETVVGGGDGLLDVEGSETLQS